MLASQARNITSNAKSMENLYNNILLAAESGKDSIEANLNETMMNTLRKKGYRIVTKPDHANERFPHIICW